PSSSTLRYPGPVIASSRPRRIEPPAVRRSVTANSMCRPLDSGHRRPARGRRRVRYPSVDQGLRTLGGDLAVGFHVDLRAADDDVPLAVQRDRGATALDDDLLVALDEEAVLGALSDHGLGGYIDALLG